MVNMPKEASMPPMEAFAPIVAAAEPGSSATMIGAAKMLAAQLKRLSFCAKHRTRRSSRDVIGPKMCTSMTKMYMRRNARDQGLL